MLLAVESQAETLRAFSEHASHVDQTGADDELAEAIPAASASAPPPSVAQFASPELLSDRAFVEAALRLDGGAFEHASEPLRADRSLALLAVQGRAAEEPLRHAAAELCDCPDLLEAARAKLVLTITSAPCGGGAVRVEGTKLCGLKAVAVEASPSDSLRALRRALAKPLG